MTDPKLIIFLGIAILTLFGVKTFFVFLIFYLVWRIVSLKMQKLKNQKTDWINAFFTQKSKATERTSQSINFLPMNFFTPKRLIAFIVAFIVAMIIIDGFVMVPAGQVAVLLDRGRGVLEKPLPTGLHLKIPFWQVATKMDTRLQTYTMSIAPMESSHAIQNAEGADVIEALTKDGQKVNVDVTVQFYLEPQNAPFIYKTVGLDYIDKIVRPAARSTVRNAITGFNSKELFQIEARQKAQDLMVKEMKSNLTRKKIMLDDVLLRNIQFSEIYLQAIEEKQVAEQKIQKAEFEKQEAVIQKDKKIIEAQAEAESIRLKGESLRQNPSVIQFEMVQKLSPNIKWGVLPDGVLPMLDMKGLQQ